MNTERSAAIALNLIEKHVRCDEHTWSIGIPGAIAEFMYDATEENIEIHVDGNRIKAHTPRGTLTINIPAETSCIAYEEFSPCIKSWSQQVVFCLPDQAAKQTANKVLTEIGPDQQDTAGQSGDEILFDIGLGSDYLRFCIHTNDKELLAALRAACGWSVLAADNTIMTLIQEKSPTRVIISALGRIEIYGKIPSKSETSMSGPHTHLLPKFLNSKKLGVPLPGGLVPLLTLYPAHPLFDKYGQPKPFDQHAHLHFQTLLEEFGLAEYQFEKSRLTNGLLEKISTNGSGCNISHWQRTAEKVIRIQQPYLHR